MHLEVAYLLLCIIDNIGGIQKAQLYIKLKIYPHLAKSPLCFVSTMLRAYYTYPLWGSRGGQGSVHR